MSKQILTPISLGGNGAKNNRFRSRNFPHVSRENRVFWIISSVVCGPKNVKIFGLRPALASGGSARPNLRRSAGGTEKILRKNVFSQEETSKIFCHRLLSQPAAECSFDVAVAFHGLRTDSVSEEKNT